MSPHATTSATTTIGTDSPSQPHRPETCSSEAKTPTTVPRSKKQIAAETDHPTTIRNHFKQWTSRSGTHESNSILPAATEGAMITMTIHTANTSRPTPHASRRAVTVSRVGTRAPEPGPFSTRTSSARVDHRISEQADTSK